ncbi:SWIB/MDM2 domain-containing protein [Chlamydoabsidia padenii]|nr:SWIB/MDM2 domain-containing protein [Chlamydoabsidia padenii]
MNVEKFKPRILDILRSSDLDTITSKSVRKLLQQETSEPLDEYKKELNALIMQCLDLVNEPEPSPPTIKQERPTSSQSSSTASIDQRPNISPPPKASRSNGKKRTSEVVDSDDEAGTTKKKSKTTTAAKKKKKPAKKRNIDAATLQKNPFTKSWLLSDTLSNLTGEKALSRPGVVKALWKYIKENQLQDPTNKIYVKCDDKLRQVFGEDRVHGFTMNKLIGKHLSDLPADYVLNGVKEEQ